MTATRSFSLLSVLLPMLLSAAAGLPAPAVAVEPPAAVQAAIRQLVRDELDDQDIAGLSLALVDDRRVLWAEGFGYADVKRKRKATPQTLYVAGGLTQALTATVALQLAEQQAIALDRPLPAQLPGFAMRSRFADAGPITPRQLLTHHAGLPAMQLRGMWVRQPEALDAFVARLREEYVTHPPGRVYAPSFPGYDVLGHLIAVKCGRSYEDCIRQKLLVPLGMTQSSFDHQRPDPQRFARHYWSEQEVPFTAIRDVPAGGLISNVLELGAFAQMLLAEGRYRDSTLLKPASVREMLRAQNADVALDLGKHVGMPWRLTGMHVPPARRVAWLANHSPFARGRIALLPEHKLAVVVMTNSSNSSDTVHTVAERLLERVLEARQPAAAARPREPDATAWTAPPGKTDIAGHYATTLGQITVLPADRGYRARLLGKTFNLTPQPEGLLAPEYRLLGFIPIPIEVLRETRLTTSLIAGRLFAIAYVRNEAHRLGERIEPVTLTPAWQKRLGEYAAVERDPLLDLIELGNVQLRHENGVLFFHYRVPGLLGLTANVPVRPVNDRALVVEGTGWMMGDTVHVVERDGRDVLRYSGYEYRRVPAP